MDGYSTEGQRGPKLMCLCDAPMITDGRKWKDETFFSVSAAPEMKRIRKEMGNSCAATGPIKICCVLEVEGGGGLWHL